ncbi:MAG: hypothetical protein HYU63_07310 [Armatimonadetes bacterium]|nr:hypothetical protein [Armatimonadota bacterium]
MYKKLLIIASILIVSIFLTGCFKAKLKIGVIDPYKLLNNWSKYRQLSLEFQKESMKVNVRISNNPKSLSPEDKKNIENSSKKWEEISKKLTEEISQKAKDFAVKNHYDFILANTGVEYGGVDITKEISALLK